MDTVVHTDKLKFNNKIIMTPTGSVQAQETKRVYFR